MNSGEIFLNLCYKPLFPIGFCQILLNTRRIIFSFLFLFYISLDHATFSFTFNRLEEYLNPGFNKIKTQNWDSKPIKWIPRTRCLDWKRASHSRWKLMNILLVGRNRRPYSFAPRTSGTRRFSVGSRTSQLALFSPVSDSIFHIRFRFLFNYRHVSNIVFKSREIKHFAQILSPSPPFLPIPIPFFTAVKKAIYSNDRHPIIC